MMWIMKYGLMASASLQLIVIWMYVTKLVGNLINLIKEME